MGRNSAFIAMWVMPIAIGAFPGVLLGQSILGQSAASPVAESEAYRRASNGQPGSPVAPQDLPPDDRQQGEPGADDLLELGIEQLRRIPVAPALEEVVSTVARQQSTVGRSPAAVYVVTPEMIRRSGAQTIAEALRMVPGLQVAQRDSNKWAISSRGFNRTFANKLLVQIDGRTVYTPVFAGTFWDVQDVVLEDIARIEVIRGPGATVWGANAVNGVINIITKSAGDTCGIYAKAGGGTHEKGFSTIRAGGCQDDLAWRAYFKWFERDGGVGVGGPAFDEWRQKRGGFRTDWTPNGQDTVTVQGDVYAGTSGTTFFGFAPEDGELQGHNVMSRWTRVIDDDTDYSLLVYYDATDREESLSVFQHVEVYDVDFQYRFPLGCRNNVIWGLQYRHVKDFLRSISPMAPRFIRPSEIKNLYSAFIQDEVTLREDLLYLTLGTKLEKNDFTGFEVQPSIRLLWLPSRRQAAWASVSRAVRTPARFDEDAVTPTFIFGGPATIGPSPGFHSEELIAYELGYRAQPVERFSWDAALFYNVYEDLRSRRLLGAAPGGPPITRLALFNDSRGHGYGGELSGRLEVTPCWRLTAWYSFLQLVLHDPSELPQGFDDDAVIEGSSPQNQVFLMSSWDLAYDVEFDLMGRYVDSLPAQSVPKYFSLDLRLGWQPTESLELSVVAQNLLDGKHLEFGNVEGKPTPPVEIPRGVFGYVTWRH